MTKIRCERLKDLTYPENMTNDELQEYILKGIIPERIKKKR